MEFTIQGRHFYSGDRKIFLNSGEIHYFRIDRNLWDTHLIAAKEAGLETISTYVPWAWHEPEESHFDFEGNTHPERDLTGWLECCKKIGLTCILKPGPFILAEFRGAGLPGWFMDKYSPGVKMHNSKGEVVASDGVSLFHEKYLEKLTLWYNRIMPLISRFEARSGGPVIMMQVCNEIGVFSWLAHQADYSEVVRKMYGDYLEKKYQSVIRINTLWGTRFDRFSEIPLPPDGRNPYVSRQDRGRDHDWHLFWRSYYAAYLGKLSKMARDRGVTVPLYHNLPGWIYGHGYEFPVNITMYDELFGEKSEIVFGVDHIPEFLSHRNMHDDRIINDITAAMQGQKPLFAAEFQCGSREYHVVTNPRELELFYKASLAHGLTGWNFYMFSQGKNKPETGYSGDTFYWFNPMTAEGEKTSAFPLVQRISRLLKPLENIILESERRAEICVLFYPPYYATELERPTDEACGMVYNSSSIRRPAYFDGLLKVLQIMNIDYDLADLTKTRAPQLSVYKQVWAFCTDEMNSPDQQTLLDYTHEGGNLVLFPYLPDREMSNVPCTLIRDALKVSPISIESVDSPLLQLYGQKDIKCSNPQVIYSGDSLKANEVIARNLNNNICGFARNYGKGNLIHLGTWMGFDTEGHKTAYRSLLDQSNARLSQAWSDSDYITVRERFTSDGSGLLFAANYYNEGKAGKVFYSNPSSGETLSIPLKDKEIFMPPLYGFISPLCLEVSHGLTLLHTTSDILAVSVQERRISITLFGDRDLTGELVLEGTVPFSAGKISHPFSIQKAGERTILTYTHIHQQEFRIILDTL